jgi:hypothetical protein
MAVMRFCGSSGSGSEEIGVTPVRGRCHWTCTKSIAHPKRPLAFRRPKAEGEGRNGEQTERNNQKGGAEAKCTRQTGREVLALKTRSVGPIRHAAPYPWYTSPSSEANA